MIGKTKPIGPRKVSGEDAQPTKSRRQPCQTNPISSSLTQIERPNGAKHSRTWVGWGIWGTARGGKRAKQTQFPATANCAKQTQFARRGGVDRGFGTRALYKQTQFRAVEIPPTNPLFQHSNPLRNGQDEANLPGDRFQESADCGGPLDNFAFFTARIAR
jgi:hypothetical protein